MNRKRISDLYIFCWTEMASVFNDSFVKHFGCFICGFLKFPQDAVFNKIAQLQSDFLRPIRPTAHRRVSQCEWWTAPGSTAYGQRFRASDFFEVWLQLGKIDKPFQCVFWERELFFFRLVFYVIFWSLAVIISRTADSNVFSVD